MEAGPRPQRLRFQRELSGQLLGGRRARLNTTTLTVGLSHPAFALFKQKAQG